MHEYTIYKCFDIYKHVDIKMFVYMVHFIHALLMSNRLSYVHPEPSNVQDLFSGRSLLGPAVNQKQRHKVKAHRNVFVSKAHHGLHGFLGDGLPQSTDQNPELSLKARPQRCMDHCTTLKNSLCMLVKA